MDISTIPVAMNVSGEIFLTTLAERNSIQKDIDMIKPQPFRTTFISAQDSCQFCKNPSGPVYVHSICIEDHFGFLSCLKCTALAKTACIEWLDTKAFGRAHELMYKSINIRRSSGIIESGWKLYIRDPQIKIINNIEYVMCIDSENKLTRMSTIDEILELNS